LLSVTRVGAALVLLGLILLSVLVVGRDGGEASWTLGAVEAVVACVGLALTLAVASGRTGGYWLIFSLVVAATVAQPFGVVAEPAPPTAPSREAGEDPGRVESIGVLGVPLARFRLESADKPPAYAESGYPTHELKARSWIVPLLLVNATPIVDMCGVVTDPCWEPDSAEGTSSDSNSVALFERAGRWHVRTTSVGDDPSTGRPVVREWRLSYGVASWTGVAYWALLVLALPVAALRRRPA